MDLLVLGGTAWLGREISAHAIERGHSVTCIARGSSGDVAAGARLIATDRTDCDLAALIDRDVDAVIELTWQPGLCESALEALSSRARHWTYVSSCSVYAHHQDPGGDESGELLAPTTLSSVEVSDYAAAKVACEESTRTAIGDRLLLVRPGLIGGPGDMSDRSGAWVARAAAAPDEELLIPDSLNLPTQVIDVRDLARWIVASIERRLVGTFDAVGPVVPLGQWIELSRAAAGHSAATLVVDPQWLLDEGVTEFMGSNSLSMWLHDPEWRGFMARTGEAARNEGLTNIAREALLADLLEWEAGAGLSRDRHAGLPLEYERALRDRWRAHLDS